MAIQQHPLPQDISSYRFRLIGDMTIKQFAALAIFGIIAIVVYGLPLPFFFKYPLTFLFLVLGVGIAFVPVQGRTLDVWIVAFIKSIYAPTLFSWKRTPTEEVNQDTASPTAGGIQNVMRSVSNPEIEINKGTPTPTPPASTPQPEVVTEPVISIPTEAKTKTTPEKEAITSPITDQTSTPSPSVEPQDISVPTPTAPPTPVAVSTPAPTTNLPIPFTPTTPNTLVGLTITSDNRIIDGVLVEIKKNGITMRATKSNKLGQFMFARPLENGTFQILAEKENYTFTTYSLELTGEIIRPLKIQAQ